MSVKVWLWWYVPERTEGRGYMALRKSHAARGVPTAKETHRGQTSSHIARAACVQEKREKTDRRKLRVPKSLLRSSNPNGTLSLSLQEDFQAPILRTFPPISIFCHLSYDRLEPDYPQLLAPIRR